MAAKILVIGTNPILAMLSELNPRGDPAKLLFDGVEVFN